MKRIIILVIVLVSSTPLLSRGFGDSFGGGFVGGFSGSLIGNAISRPRQQRNECVYQQPVQTRVVEVHKPTYIVQKPSNPYKKEEKRRRRQQEEDILRQQRLQEIAGQQTSQNAVRPLTSEVNTELKMRELACKEKELEIKKMEVELAKTQAENEQLKLKLQQATMVGPKK